MELAWVAALLFLPRGGFAESAIVGGGAAAGEAGMVAGANGEDADEREKRKGLSIGKNTSLLSSLGTPVGGGASTEMSSFRPLTNNRKTQVPTRSNQQPEAQASILTRDYVGDPPWLPCPWGQPSGLCKYQGKSMIEAYPPPNPAAFKEITVDDLPLGPSYVTGGHSSFIWYLLEGPKAMRFKARKNAGIVVDFGSQTRPDLMVPTEMFVSISRKKGDYLVPPGCLVTPASMHNSASEHSGVRIEVRWGPGSEAERLYAQRGQLCLLEPNGEYFLNVSGDCSSYWDPQRRYLGWNNRCPTVLGNVNYWATITKP